MATKKGNGKSNCRSKTAKNASKTGAVTTEKKGGGTSLAPVKKGEVNKPKKDIFANASQISITKNSIIVTEKEAKTVNGCFIKREKKIYHKKTAQNLAELSRKMNNTGQKKMIVEFK